MGGDTQPAAGHVQQRPAYVVGALVLLQLGCSLSASPVCPASHILYDDHSGLKALSAVRGPNTLALDTFYGPVAPAAAATPALLTPATVNKLSLLLLSTADHEELVEVIANSGALFSPWQAAWLKALTTTTAIDAFDNTNNAVAGSDSSSSGDGAHKQQKQQQQQQPVVPDFLPPAGQAAWLGAGGSDSAGTGAERLPFEALGMDEEKLWAASGEGCLAVVCEGLGT